jgi:hypothetical protein
LVDPQKFYLQLTKGKNHNCHLRTFAKKHFPGRHLINTQTIIIETCQPIYSSPNGKLNIVSQMSVGQMSVGQMSVGKMSVGQMCVGKMSVGQMSVGQMSVGQMTAVKMTAGKMTAGKMSVGKMSVGQMSVGEMSVGQNVSWSNLPDKCFYPKS